MTKVIVVVKPNQSYVTLFVLRLVMIIILQVVIKFVKLIAMNSGLGCYHRPKIDFFFIFSNLFIFQDAKNPDAMKKTKKSLKPS